MKNTWLLKNSAPEKNSNCPGEIPEYLSFLLWSGQYGILWQSKSEKTSCSESMELTG